MKLPALMLLAGAAGLAVAVRGLEASRGPSEMPSQTSYYANGQVEMECEVRDGRREGECRRFRSDGAPAAQGRYAAGKMEGAWTFWREDGSVDPDRSGLYVAGERVGPLGDQASSR